MLKPMANLKPTWSGILFGFLRPGREHTKSLNYMTQTDKEKKETIGTKKGKMLLSFNKTGKNCVLD